MKQANTVSVLVSLYIQLIIPSKIKHSWLGNGRVGFNPFPSSSNTHVNVHLERIKKENVTEIASITL